MHPVEWRPEAFIRSSWSKSDTSFPEKAEEEAQRSNEAAENGRWVLLVPESLRGAEAGSRWLT